MDEGWRKERGRLYGRQGRRFNEVEMRLKGRKGDSRKVGGMLEEGEREVVGKTGKEI